MIVALIYIRIVVTPYYLVLSRGPPYCLLVIKKLVTIISAFSI